MLQFQQHLFRICVFAQMMSCFVHYDIIDYPFPVNSQYLKMSGVDSPECGSRPASTILWQTVRPQLFKSWIALSTG